MQNRGLQGTRSSWLIISLALFLAFAVRTTAQTPKKSFDLPAGAAEKTLRLFSAQSGLPVLFPTEITKGVRTEAVRGDFPPREALDRMLAGTVLTVVRNGKPDAFAIQRINDPNAHGAAPATGGDRPTTQRKTPPLKNPPST